MPIRVNQPGRTNAVPQTVPVPLNNTGAQLTANSRRKGLAPSTVRIASPGQQLLTTQRQTFGQPLKRNSYS